MAAPIGNSEGVLTNKASVELINGRRVVRPAGQREWFVELRGREYRGKRLPFWRKFDRLDLAKNEAFSLGPIPDTPEA
jgi:hypothetical protein